MKKRSIKLGLNLISFDYATGELKVGIEHFTKYNMGISDELEDEEDN